MSQKACLLALFLALLATAVWTSSVVEDEKRSSSLNIVETFKNSMPGSWFYGGVGDFDFFIVGASIGRSLLGDDDDGGSKKRRGGSDDDDDDDGGSKKRRGGSDDDDDDGGSKKRRGGSDDDDDDDDGSKKRRGGSDDDDDDDDGSKKRRGGSDDDDGRRKRGSDDDDDGFKRPPRFRPRPPRRRFRRHPGPRSFVGLRGILRVIVYGNGHTCFIKVHQNGMSYREQFGRTTSTSAFISLYGYGVCKPGATGVAYGYAKASVFAEAYYRGGSCMTSVVTEVITKTYDMDPHDGIFAIVGGAAGGEALAVCH